MAILRKWLVPVQQAQPVVAPQRRRRNMAQPEFYEEQQQQIQQPQATPQTPEFVSPPSTGDMLQQQLDEFQQNRKAPPELSPGARVRTASLDPNLRSSLQKYYDQLGSVSQIGSEMTAAAAARAQHKKMQELQGVMSQRVPGFNNPTLQGGGGDDYIGVGTFSGDINALKGAARATPASAYQGKVGRGPAWHGGGNLSTWTAAATAVLQSHGVRLSPSDIQAINIIVKHESGAGSPNLQNNWDSNARKGIPSRGLMQTIQPTFDNNRIPGYDDVWNPIHNIIAAVRYSIRRYGSLNNVPGVKSIRAGKGYRPY